MQIKFIVAGVVVLGLVILLILLLGNKKKDDNGAKPVDTKCESTNTIRKCDCSTFMDVYGQGKVCEEPGGFAIRKRNLCTNLSNQDKSSCETTTNFKAGTCKWTETGCID